MSNENLKGTLWEDSDSWDTYKPCCVGECKCPPTSIGLDSVGSWVDQDGNVFADGDDGKFEYSGVHIYDVCDEWWENISMEDTLKLFPFLAEIKELYYSEGYMSWALQKFGIVEEANNEFVNFDTEWVVA